MILRSTFSACCSFSTILCYVSGFVALSACLWLVLVSYFHLVFTHIQKRRFVFQDFHFRRLFIGRQAVVVMYWRNVYAFPVLFQYRFKVFKFSVYWVIVYSYERVAFSVERWIRSSKGGDVSRSIILLFKCLFYILRRMVSSVPRAPRPRETPFNLVVPTVLGNYELACTRR